VTDQVPSENFLPMEVPVSRFDFAMEAVYLSQLYSSAMDGKQIRHPSPHQREPGRGGPAPPPPAPHIFRSRHESRIPQPQNTNTPVHLLFHAYKFNRILMALIPRFLSDRVSQLCCNPLPSSRFSTVVALLHKDHHPQGCIPQTVTVPKTNTVYQIPTFEALKSIIT
jgi:hypothetical protein